MAGTGAAPQAGPGETGVATRRLAVEVLERVEQGAYANLALPAALGRSGLEEQDRALVTDLVYTPIDTDFLRAARARGCATVDGLGMLLHQAAPGFERWFGLRPEVDEALRAAVLG